MQHFFVEINKMKKPYCKHFKSTL